MLVRRILVKRTIQAIIIPPVAVCRYGCAGCCAAPIGVFWIAGITSIIYAFFGGPAGLETISWGTLALGIVLWVIAAVWAENTIKGVKADECENRVSSVCRMVAPKVDEADPLDEVKKFQ